MVQEPRRDEPLYSCIVPVAIVTGNQEEELTTFGTGSIRSPSRVKVFDYPLEQCIDQICIDIIFRGDQASSCQFGYFL